jgi:hypothetical protein
MSTSLTPLMLVQALVTYISMSTSLTPLMLVQALVTYISMSTSLTPLMLVQAPVTYISFQTPTHGQSVHNVCHGFPAPISLEVLIYQKKFCLYDNSQIT